MGFCGVLLDMNIIKGIDRIALVLAIIVMVVVSVLVVGELQKGKTTPEYRTWEKEYNDRIKYLEKKNPSIKLKPNDLLFFGPIPDDLADLKLTPKLRKREEVLKDDTILQNILSRRPDQYKYLPAWKPYVYGIVAAFISFMIVLLGIRGATRGIKWFSLWIIEGFKDEKKSRNNS